MSLEIKSIPGYSKYVMTNEGDVISISEYKKLAKCIVDVKSTLVIPLRKTNVHNGYERVTLVNDDGIKKSEYIHTLVARTFIGKNNKHMVVNHKDGNKHNNNVENLEYITQEENVLHAIFTGLRLKGMVAVTHYIDYNDHCTAINYQSISEASRMTHLSKYMIKRLCDMDNPETGWEYFNA